MAQLVLPLATRPALKREDFIVGAGNREAVAFLDAWPDWPSHIAALHGPPGSGKSHLAQIWAERANAHIVDAAALDDSFVLGGSPIAVENIDCVPPDAARDHAIFALIERGGPVLITGRDPPAAWPATMPDLTSRYRALLSFALWAPDDELLGALARKLFSDRQLAVPDSAIDHMIRLLERSPAAIWDFVVKADAKALSERRPVTAALVREMLGG